MSSGQRIISVVEGLLAAGSALTGQILRAIGAKDPDGNIQPAEITSFGHLKTGLFGSLKSQAFVTDFGALLAAPENPLFHSTFHNPGVPSRLWTMEVEGATASWALSEGALVLSSGLGVGESELLSRYVGVHRPGVVVKFVTALSFGDTGEVGNTRMFGLGHDRDGVFIRLNGTVLEFVRRKKYVETVTLASAWDTPVTPDANAHRWEIATVIGGATCIWLDNVLVHIDMLVGLSPGSAITGHRLMFENLNTAAVTSDHSLTVWGTKLVSIGDAPQASDLFDISTWQQVTAAGVLAELAATVYPIMYGKHTLLVADNGFPSRRAIQLRKIEAVSLKENGTLKVIKNAVGTAPTRKVEAPVDPSVAWTGIVTPVTTVFTRRIDISAWTGFFRPAEGITGAPSGGTATVEDPYKERRLSVSADTGLAVADTLTGALSGTTATVDTISDITGTGYAVGDSLQYKITAFGALGETLPSVTTGAIVVPATINRVLLSWQPIAYALAYGVYRSVNVGPYELIGVKEVTQSGLFFEDNAEIAKAGVVPPAASTAIGSSNMIWQDAPASFLGGEILLTIGMLKKVPVEVDFHGAELTMVPGETIAITFQPEADKTGNLVYGLFEWEEVLT